MTDNLRVSVRRQLESELRLFKRASVFFPPATHSELLRVPEGVAQLLSEFGAPLALPMAVIDTHWKVVERSGQNVNRGHSTSYGLFPWLPNSRVPPFRYTRIILASRRRMVGSAGVPFRHTGWYQG
jgi:hypothetical protein